MDKWTDFWINSFFWCLLYHMIPYHYKYIMLSSKIYTWYQKKIKRCQKCQKLRFCVKIIKIRKKKHAPPKMKILTNWADKVCKIRFKNFCQLDFSQSAPWKKCFFLHGSIFEIFPKIIFVVLRGVVKKCSKTIQGFTILHFKYQKWIPHEILHQKIYMGPCMQIFVFWPYLLFVCEMLVVSRILS